MNMKNIGSKRSRKMAISAMLMAVGIVLPIFTGQIPQIGNMLLPMHLPVIVCGLICGWQYGGIVGFLLPLLRYVLFAMPPMPNGLAMAFELAAYGAISGFLYSRSRWQCIVSSSPPRSASAPSSASLSSLAQFGGLLKDYMRTYNTSVHSGIGTTPMERYQQTRSSIRMPKSREWLEECFLNRNTRKVGRDSAVSIDKVSYDVPMQFISSKVEIRFLPDDMSSAFILYEGEHYPIRPTDKNENCRAKRNNPPSMENFFYD